MKKTNLIITILILVFTTTACGPRRYKCGPYRKCENYIKKHENKEFNNELNKIKLC